MPPAPCSVRVDDAIPPNTWRQRCSGFFGQAALILAVSVLVASFLLMSPPRGEIFPGAIPWGQLSLLRPLVELLSLGGLIATERGTEIKDLAFHAGAALALLLAALRWLMAGAELGLRANWTRPWLGGQLLLLSWVAISAASSLWSDDPDLAHGQAALYALALSWAIGLGWALEARHLPRLLGWLVGTSAGAAALCVWYYYERNPYHRPGFPVGNPATLAAALLPAILTAGAITIEALGQRPATRRRLRRAALLSIAALLPLVYAFSLAGARAATVGLAIGALVLLLSSVGRRARLLIGAVFLIGLAAGAANLLNRSRLDAAMARSATIRFRLYAWRYAAQLWSQNQLTAIAGCGAGQYPRLSAWLSLNDRKLDPAAFMADLVEHAHNELLETICEIGLVGGVSFVAGMLAILVTGWQLVRSPPAGSPRWTGLALTASSAALLTDALLSPGLRLTVVPAVFYTLVGATWSAGRSSAKGDAAEGLAPGATKPSPAAPRIVVGVGTILLSAGAGWLACCNWIGALLEESARQASYRGDHLAGVEYRELARRQILNPVRQLTNQAEAVHGRLRVAQGVSLEFLAVREALEVPPICSPSAAAAIELKERRWQALLRCVMAYEAGIQLAERVPGAFWSAGVAASAAELARQVLSSDDLPGAEQWTRRAVYCWRAQRQWRPWDFETLTALTEYPAPPDYHVGLLRDALRCTQATTRWGQPLSLNEIRARWYQAFVRLSALPTFEDLLSRFLAAVGPINPQTDVDTLIWSGAPEVRRLTAYYHAARGNYSQAQRQAAQAAHLYQPMRSRFPLLESVALLEQAEFTLQESPRRALQAVELLKTALLRLPQVQFHKRAALEQPFRRAIADCYVALVQTYTQEPAASRPDLDHLLEEALHYQPDHLRAWAWRAWLAAENNNLPAVHRVLNQAAQCGLSDSQLETIRRSLCLEFPALCGALDPRH